MERKVCPILKAGTMIEVLSSNSNIARELVFPQINVRMKESPECIRESCEWFNHGCPAHLLDPGAIKEIEERQR